MRDLIVLSLGMTLLIGCEEVKVKPIAQNGDNTATVKEDESPSAPPISSLREVSWRLVETNNPAESYRALSEQTYLFLDFEADFKGTVKKVVNNDQFDTPLLTFVYNVDPEGALLVVKYSMPADPNGEGTSTDIGTVKYTYSMTGRELLLEEQTRPYYYRYAAKSR